MNTEKDKELDDFFKKGLEDPVSHAGFIEGDWNSLEKMLEKHTQRKGVIYWLPVLSSVAALLLLFLGWWIFKPENDHQQPRRLVQTPIHHQPVNTGTSGGSTRQPIDHQPTKLNPANYAVNSHISKAGRNDGSLLSKPAAGSRRDITGMASNNLVSREPGAVLAAVSQGMVFDAVQMNAVAVDPIYLPKPAVNQPGALSSSKNGKNVIRKQPTFRPQFALSVIAAPDLNGVGSFQQSKLGTNVGMLFSADITKRFTISTGAIYSLKPYLTTFADYHTAYKFPVNPVNVTADCRMLDIPLNLGYQFYNKHQNKLSVGTGLSSYIMLHESYKFNYADAYNTGPANYTVPSSSKYFFGVLNLNATYERQLNSKVALSVSPYLKMPLTNIGYSEVRLQTTGIAVGLKWNLNSSSKP